ncbi:MAG: PH domain-containing protein [Winkia neuii]|uniref:YdbS-like PH domain-containing protein n=1 Tax=Winkia neuii TaxID=33007 RepID=A0A2I1INN4_9ACTO|nr:PH domain-containing protein [Winkia neuii]OFJ71508.1 hypothetical protein HMPREF2851_06660 [Actinomyces sp. HMSC064C12]OFK01174.1 hypothetical protein HMPREF2835_10435 [Actinomyces sp. HMSC072A03]OFT55785.1 hypothetical protein HMPREF3152_03785 [Actinomyces sp. HMSC06A08]KWZ73150.1 hypothetical protein HMPREF3198_01508 [Winkia neuii]MDK8099027.1 PH domain-containing protein [Winkia neuii]
MTPQQTTQTAPQSSANEVREDQWRRVHKLSPLLNSGAALGALVGVFALNNVKQLSELAGTISHRFSALGATAVTLGAIVVVFALIGGLMFWQWRNTYFAITTKAVHFRHGIFFKAHRRAPLDRIQSVDISRPLLARVLGLAELNVETAGGADSHVKIKYLAVGEAEDVRREILHQEDAARPNEDEAPSRVQEVEDSGVAHSGILGKAYSGPNFQPWKLYELDLPIFLGGLVRSIGNIVAALVVIAALVAAVVGASIFGSGELAVALGGVGAIISLVAAVAAVGSVIWTRVNSEYGFAASVTHSGIRITRGLTKQVSQTIPPGRIHAVRLRQPLLWRSKDWWRVSALQAGVGLSAKSSEDSTGNGGKGEVTLLPTGTRDQALRALWLVVRDLGVENPDEFLEEALTGSGEGKYFTPVGRKVRLLDPLTYNRKSVFITDTVVVVRDGRITRHLDIIPHEHAQSVTAEQGPLERRLKVGNMNLDVVPNAMGIGKVKHLNQRVLAEAVLQQAELARLRRGEEPMADWQARMAKASA